MKAYMRSIFVLLLPIVFFSCNNNNESDLLSPENWLIPANEVFDGGPGKDGIPAISNPEMIPAESATYLSDNDLVVGYVDGEEARAYPHKILDWHEIINDQFSDYSFSVIYCPLTGTATNWERGNTTFGVSGLLYNTNVIPYDRGTDSNWSQIYLKCVNGSRSGDKAKLFPIIETTWKTWKTMYPETKAVSTNTGFNRNYQQFPYGDYRTNNNNIIFPVSVRDNRLPAKERVLTVILEERARAYQFNNMESLTVIHDTFQGKEIIVIGSHEDNFAIAFSRRATDGTLLDFESLQGQLPLVMVGSDGTKWDIMGRAVEGAKVGERLEFIPQMIGYWFSFASFYPDIEIAE